MDNQNCKDMFEVINNAVTNHKQVTIQISDKVFSVKGPVSTTKGAGKDFLLISDDYEDIYINCIEINIIRIEKQSYLQNLLEFK